MTADRQAITLRVPIEIHDWLRERSYESRLSQAGILLAALDVARRGEESVIRQAAVAISERFETRWFGRSEVMPLINHWLAERPDLAFELHALGFVQPQKRATADTEELWEVMRTS